MELICPIGMPLDYKGNGCGSGWKEPLVPDTLGGIDISEACSIHDYMYEEGGAENDREYADRCFLFNMLTIIHRDDTWITNEDVAIKWAILYYQTVREYGEQYFNYRSDML